MITRQKIQGQNYFFFQDGLVDIFIGISIIFAGIFIQSGLFWMAGILIPILLPSYQAARKRFVPNKQHIINFTNDRLIARSDSKLFLFTLLTGSFVLLGLTMIFFFSQNLLINLEWLQTNILLLLGSCFGVFWILTAVIFSVPRFILNGLWTTFVFILLEWTDLRFGSALLILGLWIIMQGLVIFLRFQRE